MCADWIYVIFYTFFLNLYFHWIEEVPHLCMLWLKITAPFWLQAQDKLPACEW